MDDMGIIFNQITYVAMGTHGFFIVRGCFTTIFLGLKNLYVFYGFLWGAKVVPYQIPKL